MRLKHKKRLKYFGFFISGLIIGLFLASNFLNPTLTEEEKIKRDVAKKFELIHPTFIITVTEDSFFLEDPDIELGYYIVEDPEKVIIYNPFDKEIVNVFEKPNFPEDLFEKLYAHLSEDDMVYDILEIEDLSIIDEDEMFDEFREKAEIGHYIIITTYGMNLYDYDADEIITTIDMSEFMLYEDISTDDMDLVSLGEAEMVNF